MSPREQFAEAIRCLEDAWDFPDGFFFRLRQGEYDASAVGGVIEILRSVDVDDESLLPRRFVSLTWWIPMFMEWQAERVAESGGDVDGLQRDVVRLRNVLDEVLGVP
jgi:hypothetical protein